MDLYRDTYKPWIFTGILFMNIWGMLDAILRFPIVHDLDTFFSVKLVLIIGAKTICYAFGFKNMGKNATLFLCCLFCCVWGLPLLYTMALPIGDTRAQQSKHDVRDVDILEKIYLLLFAKNDKEMRDDFRRQLRYWRDSAVAFGLGVPGLSALLRRSNLVDRRLLKKPAGREI